MSSRTTRLASGLTWTLVTKFAIVKPRAAAAAGDGTTASRTASATSARAIPSAPERDAGRLPLSGAVELEVSPRVELEEGRDEVRREGLHRGVEVAHDRVVVAARVLDRLLQLAERPLELDEVRVRLEVRIRLGERHELAEGARERVLRLRARLRRLRGDRGAARAGHGIERGPLVGGVDRKSTRLNSSHTVISYAVFCLKKKMTVTSRSTVPHPRSPPVATLARRT